MIVVDVNILLYHAFQGPFTPRIAQLVAKDDEWYTSFFWRFEFVNVLKNMVKAKQLTIDEAIAGFEATELRIANGERIATCSEVLRTAVRYDISSYDAQYIAVAEQLQIKCITADQPLAKKVPTIAVSLSEFVK